MVNRILFFLTICILLHPFFLCAHDETMLNLRVCTTLSPKQSYFQVEHKFHHNLRDYGNDAFNVFNSGANVNLGIRYLVWDGLALDFAYTTLPKEKTVGASYVKTWFKNRLLTQSELQYFVYKHPFATTSYISNMFYLLVLQTPPLFSGTIVPILNVGYDGYNDTAGFGFGLSGKLTQNIFLLAEYFPRLRRQSANPNSGGKDGYAAGVRIHTYGHQFIFSVSNSSEIGTRRTMLSGKTDFLYFGFQIKRLFF